MFDGLKQRASLAAENALELMRVGRLSQPYKAPYEVIDQGPHHRLRRYATASHSDAPPALLVPPLMVTSEIYDLEAENSAVTALGDAGVTPYVVDFGAPEREEGGMARTLDDHVLAVVKAIEHVRRITGRDVHLLGYSQGGMFAYQAAAFLRSEGIKSVVTFGSPVDLHKSLPAMHRDATALMIRFVEPVVSRSIERISGLPGVITSTAFKLVSTRKEIEQRIDFLKKLHDRGALVRREARRRFLGGEGFVAWPGPAFREFVDQFIVHNRMLSGGFVLSQRTVTLADIRCPVLAFIGTTDDMARPATIRAITRAAPEAAISFATIRAGHFGIVVGSRAMRETWPTVAGWILHQEGKAPLPEKLVVKEGRSRGTDDEPEGAGFDLDVVFDTVVDRVGEGVRALFERAGDAASSASDALDGVRYQEPRLRRLANIRSDSRVSASFALSERARQEPDATFFLWQSRAFTCRDADQRVSNVVRGLWHEGVRPGDRVAVLMRSRPSFLSVVTALSRLGAVAVLAPPEAEAAALAQALSSLRCGAMVTDADLLARAARARDQFPADAGAPRLLVLGGGSRVGLEQARAIDLEVVDLAQVQLPSSLELDAGRAADLALILLRPNDRGALRAAPVTNHRWALSALGAAAACTLKPDDTVYACIPLHHPAGILVSVGSALASGARLALADGFERERFLDEVRRYGATVAFYAGEMLRPLLFAPPSRGDRTLPLRLFAGSGMRDDLWQKLHERFGVGVIEFYASTTERLIMANASGQKVGSLGRRLPGSAEVEVAKIDLSRGELLRDTDGRLVPTPEGEPGVLCARLEPSDSPSTSAVVVPDAFQPGDRWFISSDIVRRDADGDLWFVDAQSGFVATPHGPVSTRAVEDALFSLPEVEMAVAWGETVSGAREVLAAVVAKDPLLPQRVADAMARVPRERRPAQVFQVERIPLTEGFRPQRSAIPGLRRQQLLWESFTDRDAPP